MKRELILSCLLLLTLFSISCQTSTSIDENVKIYFEDENEFNIINSTCVFKDKIYVGGFHYQSKVEGKPVYTVLCLDSELNTIWKKDYGNYDSEERMQGICVDANNNLYIVGASNYFENNSKPFILKTDSLGDLVWKKEFTDFSSFDQIRSDGNALIVTAKIADEDTFFNDSCAVLRLNVDGEAIWTKKISKLSSGQYIDLYKDKIITSRIAEIFNSTYPDSKITCLSSSGDIEWEFDLTKETTGIDKGVYIFGQYLDGEDIYVICRSANPFVKQFKAFKLGLDGILKEEIDFEENTEHSNKEGLYSKLMFVLSDYKINRYSEGNIAYLYKKADNSVALELGLTDVWMEYLGISKIGNVTYLFGNVVNQEKHTAYWKIEKID